MIAYFQWRLKYPSKLRHDPKELEDIIIGRIGHLTTEILTDETVSDETIANSQIGRNFLYQNRFVDAYKPFFINSFSIIGWSDPFPNDDEFIKGSLDDGDGMSMPKYFTDLVYNESRYIEGFSPYCIYIPKKEIMVKIMRACIAVKCPHDLWIHQELECPVEGLEYVQKDEDEN